MLFRHFHKTGFIVLFLLFCLLKGAVWAISVPFFQGPDEEAHFSYIQFLAEQKKIPSYFEFKTQEIDLSQSFRKSLELLQFDSVRFNPLEHQTFNEESLWGPNETNLSSLKYSRTPVNPYMVYNYPPTYYLLNVPLYFLFRTNILEAIFSMRMVSVLLSMGTLFFAYQSFKILLKKKYAFGATLLILFFPMFAYISSMINNDNLLNFAYAGFFASALALFQKEQIHLKECIFLSLWVFLGVVAKTQGYGLIMLFILFLWMNQEKFKKGVKTLKIGILCGAGLGGILGLKMILFHGGGRLGQYIDFFLWRTDLSPQDAISYYISEVFRSFWGNFGWLDTELPKWVYWSCALFTGMAILGLLKGVFWGKKYWDKKEKWLFWSSILIEGVYAFYFFDKAILTEGIMGPNATQGRFLFIILIPLIYLGLKGFLNWFPKRWENRAFFALILGMMIFHGLVLFNVILPRYYG